jgi:hypothetical protein
MRRVIAAAVLALTVPAAPAWAAPQGAPTRLRAAVAADHASKPAALTEWWALRLLDPRSQGWVEIRVHRDLDPPGGRIIGIDASGKTIDDSFGAPDLAADRSTLTASGPDGRLRFSSRGRRLTIATGAATGTLRLVTTARGPAAVGWRLGDAARPPDWREKPVTASWSMLVATATARGSLVLRDGRRISLRGWRASYEHGWGDILLDDREWEHADEAIVHGRSRQAWVLFGLNRTDTITGPGARDAQWLGLLARVRGDRLTVCRPRVDRRRWLSTYPEFHLWASRTRVRCNGIDLRVRDKPGRYDEYIGHLEVRSRTIGRRPGFAVHIAHPQL